MKIYTEETRPKFDPNFAAEHRRRNWLEEDVRFFESLQSPDHLLAYAQLDAHKRESPVECLRRIKFLEVAENDPVFLKEAWKIPKFYYLSFNEGRGETLAQKTMLHLRGQSYSYQRALQWVIDFTFH